MIKIDYNKCFSCGVCEEACLFNAIKIINNFPEIHDGCTNCGNCINACPEHAISLATNRKKILENYSGILVVIENNPLTNTPQKVSYELLSCARKLANQLGEVVYALDICKKAKKPLYSDLETLGCDYLLLAENEVFEVYDTDIFSGIVTDLIEKYKPSIVLIPGTENGRDLAPRVAARLRVGLTADCIDLQINEKKELVQIRPTYGGNIIASIVTPNHRPQMATIRPNIFRVAKPKNFSKLSIVKVPTETYTNLGRVKREKIITKPVVHRNLDDADIVFIGGYGVKKEEFNLLYKLADKLNAAVGVTRKVVDEGIAPSDIQIGQTGKIIAPKLCICMGVSGSLQHTIGIKGADKIIAVNRDPTAQIFGISDKAILADCGEIIRYMLKKVENK